MTVFIATTLCTNMIIVGATGMSTVSGTHQTYYGALYAVMAVITIALAVAPNMLVVLIVQGTRMIPSR